jgi:hypothetical protein
MCKNASSAYLNTDLFIELTEDIYGMKDYRFISLRPRSLTQNLQCMPGG